MSVVNTPVINNEDMPEESFVYSDGEFDYCIVNGESLTKYYGRKGGEYESYPIHQFADPLGILDRVESIWLRTLLRYDAMSPTPKYKKRKDLIDNINKRIEIDLFGYSD